MGHVFSPEQKDYPLPINASSIYTPSPIIKAKDTGLSAVFLQACDPDLDKLMALNISKSVYIKVK